MLSLTVASLAVWTSTGPCEVVGTCVHSSGYPLNYGAKESCTISMDPPAAEPAEGERPRPRGGAEGERDAEEGVGEGGAGHGRAAAAVQRADLSLYISML